MRCTQVELMAEQRVLPSAKLSPQLIHELLDGWDYDACFICSVVPRGRDVLMTSVGVPLHVLTHQSRLNFSLEDYEGRATLGADRIANAAAIADGELPAMAIDLGTAITYDVIVDRDATSSFAGGVIAPGLASLTQYLHRNTALLPAIDPQVTVTALGQNTKDALHAGSMIGYLGMVRETISALCAELGEKAHVVATGGDARIVSPQLASIDKVDALLTFRGMLKLATLQPRAAFK